MTIVELQKILDIAIQLGEGGAKVCINESRDGNDSFTEAKALFVDVGCQSQPCKILTFTYA